MFCLRDTHEFERKYRLDDFFEIIGLIYADNFAIYPLSFIIYQKLE